MRKIILPVAIFIGLIGCRSLSDTGSSSFSDSNSPYVKEEPKVKPVVKETKDIVVKEEKVKVIEEEDKSFKYYVIIGSFKVLSNAKTYKSTLIEEGFTPVILENENGLYRVSVAAYNDEMDARNKVGMIRNQYEKYNDTWLLIRKM
ncbi:SPOR domain-containing protein [Plebeiibacterium sediminum]|uniref:SPOR domain-containing protein n=1 Tax=Plebeiibacterium sediminum TaxID=2992112 RepID=A0AAE3M720_9BACT|nr:SPOR domain-containing protein [Plebeiobacterium sediminum]MCW3788314.1 SPOR domain-containing protein [Plebeiobacterium sediminum]